MKIKTRFTAFYWIFGGIMLFGQLESINEGTLDMYEFIWVIPWIVVAVLCTANKPGLAYGWNIVNLIYCAVLIIFGIYMMPAVIVMGAILAVPTFFAQLHFTELKAREAA